MNDCNQSAKNKYSNGSGKAILKESFIIFLRTIVNPAEKDKLKH